MSRRRPRKLHNLSRSADGLWRFQMVNPETGERTRISLGRVSEDEAIAMRDEILAGTGNLLKPKHGTAVRFVEVTELYLGSPRFEWIRGPAGSFCKNRLDRHAT